MNFLIPFPTSKRLVKVVQFFPVALLHCVASVSQNNGTTKADHGEFLA